MTNGILFLLIYLPVIFKFTRAATGAIRRSLSSKAAYLLRQSQTCVDELLSVQSSYDTLVH